MIPFAILALLFCGNGLTQNARVDAEPAPAPIESALPVADVSGLAMLIDQRLSYMRDVAAYKWVNGLPIEDLERERVVLDKSAQSAAKFGLDPVSVRPFVQSQMDLAKQIQTYWFRQWTRENSPPREFRDLKNEIRPELLRLGDEILQAIARLTPWEYSDGALGTLQPVFVAAMNNELVSFEQKVKLFLAVQGIGAARK